MTDLQPPRPPWETPPEPSPQLPEPPARPARPRVPTWLTFLAGMLTMAALFVGVGLGIFAARDRAAAAAVSGGTSGSTRQPVPSAIVGRVVEVNPGQGQLLVRNRAGRFVIVNVNTNTAFKRGEQRLTLEEARAAIRRNTPVLVLGRRNNDTLQALVVNIFPPGAPNLSASLPNPNNPRPPILPSPRASPSPSPTPAG